MHNFPGAGKILSADFLFDLAEDFCRQILSEKYEPSSYRAIADSKYSRKARMKEINDEIARLYEEANELSKLWNMGVLDTDGTIPDNVVQGPWESK